MSQAQALHAQNNSHTLDGHMASAERVLSPRSQQKKLSESRTVVNRQASILDENRIVLYKKGKRMGRGYYIVEVSSGHTQLYITAFNVEKPQSLILEIPEKRARFILDQFDHDFDALAASLTVANENKLILLNPHYAPAPSRQQLAFLTKMRRDGAYNTINFSTSDGDVINGGPVSDEEFDGGVDPKIKVEMSRGEDHTIDSAGVGSVEPEEPPQIVQQPTRTVKTSQDMQGFESDYRPK